MRAFDFWCDFPANSLGFLNSDRQEFHLLFLQAHSAQGSCVLDISFRHWFEALFHKWWCCWWWCVFLSLWARCYPPGPCYDLRALLITDRAQSVAGSKGLSRAGRFVDVETQQEEDVLPIPSLYAFSLHPTFQCFGLPGFSTLPTNLFIQQLLI